MPAIDAVCTAPMSWSATDRIYSAAGRALYHGEARYSTGLGSFSFPSPGKSAAAAMVDWIGMMAKPAISTRAAISLAPRFRFTGRHNAANDERAPVRSSSARRSCDLRPARRKKRGARRPLGC